MKKSFMICALVALTASRLYADSQPKVLHVEENYDFSKKVTCAVLPFYYDSDDKKATASMLRDIFTASLNEDALRLVKNSAVDAAIGAGAKRYTDAELAAAGKKLNADVVIFGEVTKRNRLYALVHSNLTVGARLRMIDVKKGDVIFDIEKEEYRNAGLLRVPTGFVEAATSPIMGLDKYYEDKITNALSRNLAEYVNMSFSPKKSSDTTPPVIYDVCADVLVDESGTRAVNIILLGEEDCEASFDIEGVVKGVPLSSSGKGNFTGSYLLEKGSGEAPGTVTVSIVDKAGQKSTRTVPIKQDQE